MQTFDGGAAVLVDSAQPPIFYPLPAFVPPDSGAGYAPDPLTEPEFRTGGSQTAPTVEPLTPRQEAAAVAPASKPAWLKWALLVALVPGGLLVWWFARKGAS